MKPRTYRLEAECAFLRSQFVTLNMMMKFFGQVGISGVGRAYGRKRERRIERFPIDFMFQLTGEQHEFLRYQIGISRPAGKEGRGGTRFLPFVFTKEGVAMLSGVLKSGRAVQVNVAIMRGGAYAEEDQGIEPAIKARRLEPSPRPVPISR